MIAPLVILIASVVFVVVAIARWRLHAFWALIFAAILVGIATALSGEGRADLAGAVEKAMSEMGTVMGRIALPIALASIIGVCLLESGGADRIVRRFVDLFGEKRADIALLGSGFVLSIPVFFDTVFFLLIPLAQTLARRTGRNYLLYLLAICGGGVITHATVPPTPGPLIMQEMLHLNLGQTILASIACGLPVAAFALWLSRRIDARMPVPVAGAANPSPPALEQDLPPFVSSVLPVIVPVILIGGASFLQAFPRDGAAAGWLALVDFLGNKNVAMLVGTLLAVRLLARVRRLGRAALADRLAPSLETAGVIILITSAGGAYGGMIKHAGLGASIEALAAGRQLNHVLLGWILAAVVRAAQGSTTVAVITAAGIVNSVAASSGWSCHPFYVYLAIGYGGIFLSWMNDSGFWLVSRLGGLNEGQTLKSWSVLLSSVSLAGLVLSLLLSTLFPLNN